MQTILIRLFANAPVRASILGRGALGGHIGGFLKQMVTLHPPRWVQSLGWKPVSSPSAPRPPIFLICSIFPHFLPHWCFQNTNETNQLVLFLLSFMQIFKPQIVSVFNLSKPDSLAFAHCHVFQGRRSSADPNPHNCSSMSRVNLRQFERWGIIFFVGGSFQFPELGNKKGGRPK